MHSCENDRNGALFAFGAFFGERKKAGMESVARRDSPYVIEIENSFSTLYEFILLFLFNNINIP